MLKSDIELRRDVEREVEWEPSIDARKIGVAVIDGIVTLTGEVTTYAEKWKAERVAERVQGVKGVANEIEVKTPSERTDTDIAKAVVDALNRNVMVPSDRIKIRVEKGWVTLKGEVNWGYQRQATERAIRNLPGIKGISNLITVKPRVEPLDMKQRIEEAFKREATIDANRITVEVNGGVVTLRGTVRSWAERREAEQATWSAPGVYAVHNYIGVVPLEEAA